jgi:uncharacterized protein YpiB (UPF0302 family)
MPRKPSCQSSGSETFSDLLVVKPFTEATSEIARQKTLEQAFLRKHALQVRKRLFLAALNEALQLQDAGEEIRPIFDTVADQLYKSDLND